MNRIDPVALVELYDKAKQIRGNWGDWASSALAAIALLSPAIRRGKGKSKAAMEAAETMMWTVGSCAANGPHEIDAEQVQPYTKIEVEAFLQSLDDVIFTALSIFGVKGYVLETLDRMQDNKEAPFFTTELWPEIRWMLGRKAGQLRRE